MKVLTLLATSAVLVLAMSSVAHAANTRVIVAAPDNDAVASRLEKELSALGFEPVRVDDAAGCARDAISAAIAEKQASGATCSDGTTVTVFVASRAGLKIADVVRPRPGEEGGHDVVAMRAAEVARASIELPASDPEPSPAPPAEEPAPVWSSTVAPPVDSGPHDARKPAAVSPRAPAFAASAGPAAMIGAETTLPAVDVEVDIRTYGRFAIATRVSAPLASEAAMNTGTRVKYSGGVFGTGVLIFLASSESLFVPRLGGGLGFVWLNSQAVFTQNLTSPTQDDIVSPSAYVNAAISMRVVGPVRLVLDGLLGATAHRMVVRADGEHLAYWGQPFGTLALRGEIVIR